MKLISALVKFHAMLLLAVGVTFLFAPEVVFPTPNADTSQPLVLAQLLGFAAAAWTARASLLVLQLHLMSSPSVVGAFCSSLMPSSPE